MTENRLGAETSPYLRQHADNPVHWYAWGDAALAAAAATERPILLSIGYSACHWCHVMAHESFENDDIAGVMNDLFVNIKVDREERPDLDAMYQGALALLGQQGGWPLTMFCLPSGEPFWGGTYFPPEARWGRPGFPEVLRQVAAVYRDQRDKVMSNVTALKDALEAAARPAAGTLDVARTLDVAADRIAESLDPRHGGMGDAPKFPNTPSLRLLALADMRNGDGARRTATTLDNMAAGGIYDHVGGGFARYSVDRIWLVPHFEKMAYDNAQLMECYTAAWQETGDGIYAARVAGTAEWLLREMVLDDGSGGGSGGGGFAAALDADAAGVEGSTYVWTVEELEDALGGEANTFAAAYGAADDGNWEGRNILNRLHAVGAPDGAAVEDLFAEARARLLAVRDDRVQPGQDDKVLADWNGQLIAALAEAAFVFGRDDWAAAARRAYDFVWQTLWDGERLAHAWCRGVVHQRGLLEDYSQLARAGVMLAETLGTDTLGDAQRLVAAAEAWLWDDGGAGYWQSAHDATDVMARAKTAADNAFPAGNGVMVEVLARLWLHTGDDAYRARAQSLIDGFAGTVAQNPAAHATLVANATLLAEATQIVVVGERDAADTRALLRAVAAAPMANRVLQVTAADAALPAGHPAHGKGQVDGAATAYVCRGQTCSLAQTSADGLREAL